MAVSVGLWVPLEAKPGKEEDVAEFLRSAQPLVEDEPGTIAWAAVRLGDSRFAIFDVFEDDAGRQAHLNGKVAAALMERADELFASPPEIDQVNVLAAKLPG
jgi:quinol monooxygenase YgiN